MTRRQATGAAWPLRDFLELGALASAVPCARRHARQVLWEWGLASLGESAGLIVTELITNAVKASAALAQVFPVRLWLASDLTRVLMSCGTPARSPRPWPMPAARPSTAAG